MDKRARRGRILRLAVAAGYADEGETLPFDPEFCVAHGKTLAAHSPQEAADDERASDG